MSELKGTILFPKMTGYIGGVGGSSGGTTNHENLTGRDSDNQHPISAISGLQTELNKIPKRGDYLSPSDLNGAINNALSQAQASGAFNGKDGKDGISPQVRINATTNEWEISTDGGKSWLATGVKATGQDGADGFSPTVDVKSIDGGHRITIKDKNGEKVFDVLDGTSSSGGGGGATADPRKTTLLCDITLGTLHVGEGNYEFIGEAPLADTILPNEVYTVNGTQVTADNDGVVLCSGQYVPDFGDVDIKLVGNTVKLVHHSSDETASMYPFEIPIKVVGLGAFTCLAQFPVVENGVTKRTFSLDPFSTVYIQQYNGEIKTVMADQNGSIAKTQFAVGNSNLGFITIGGGELTLDVRENEGWFDQYYANTMLSLWTDVANIGAAGSGGSAQGSSKDVYYLQSGYYAYLNIPVNSPIAVTINATSYDFTRRIVIQDGYVAHDTEYGNISLSCWYDHDTLTVYSDSHGLYITVEQLSSYKEISCFIKGTEILLRDPVTLELYTKNIEDVLPFEYCAFWNPAKGRIDATRVLAPPIVGDAEEYDRLYFDNGKVVDVYGVQFFWNVDTDMLVDWAKMEAGTRVCTDEGDIVSFVRSEHIVPTVPAKHYTLLTMRGRYIANGIVVGDKRDLIYPRMMAPERKRYWRLLNEVDQNNIKRAHTEGCHRRNWKYSKELHDALQPLVDQKRSLEKEIATSKTYLSDTDYKVTKYAEGVLSEYEFAPVKSERAYARNAINSNEVIVESLDYQIKNETERVRIDIANTWQPKYAGKFVGKRKVVLDEQ